MHFKTILLSWEYHTVGKTHELQPHTWSWTGSQTRAPNGALTFFGSHRIDSKQLKRISTSFRKPQIRGTPLKQGLARCLFQYAGLRGHSRLHWFTDSPWWISWRVAPEVESIYHLDLYRESWLIPAFQDRKGMINPNHRTVVTTKKREVGVIRLVL